MHSTNPYRLTTSDWFSGLKAALMRPQTLTEEDCQHLQQPDVVNDDSVVTGSSYVTYSVDRLRLMPSTPCLTMVKWARCVRSSTMTWSISLTTRPKTR